jgi:hypothetical protein
VTRGIDGHEDAGVYPGIDETWSAQLNVENIFNKGYRASADGDNNFSPGQGRTVRVFGKGEVLKIKTPERQRAGTDRSGIDRINRAAKFHLAGIDAFGRRIAQAIVIWEKDHATTKEVERFEFFDQIRALLRDR